LPREEGLGQKKAGRNRRNLTTAIGLLVTEGGGNMFKRFDASNDVSTSTQVKASVQRGIKSQISTSHPSLTDDILDELLPKKSPLVQYKIGPHLMLYCRQHEGGGDEPVFFQHRDGPILPTLKFVHKYPELVFTNVTVDKGAIPFMLGGANVMCPGLTNVGGEMPSDEEDKPGLQKGDGVIIYAEGKELPLAVGFMTMSSKDIRTKNKGTGIEVCHFLGDGLWGTDEIQ
jgi:PUA domain protein